MSTLVGVLPTLRGFAIAGTVTLAAWFGAAALLSVAAAHPTPRDPGGDPAGPRTSAAGQGATGGVSAG